MNKFIESVSAGPIYGFCNLIMLS